MHLLLCFDEKISVAATLTCFALTAMDCCFAAAMREGSSGKMIGFAEEATRCLMDGHNGDLIEEVFLDAGDSNVVR